MAYRSHYDPNQPRVPAGAHNGGQWASSADVCRLPLYREGEDGSHSALAQRNFAAALSLFDALSSLNDPKVRATFQVKAREYELNGTEGLSPANVIILTRDRVKRYCPRLELVQGMLDNIVNLEKPFKASMSPQEYGTRIHSMLKKTIDATGDPDFKTEISFLKVREAEQLSQGTDGLEPPKYGAPGTIRIDVFEKMDQTIACVYDIKTGREGLSPARFNEMMRAVRKAYREVNQIIITEVRPTR